jgi:RNA polymerase sigma-70 factor (ECF subfamily)
MTSSEHWSLSDLLNRARDGDESACNRLFEQCRTYVNVVARAQVESWLQAKVDASDLVQQTLMEAHRGLAGFRGQTQAEWLAWLRGIVKHNAADFVRHYQTADKRQARREIPLFRGADDDSRAAFFDPSDPGESPSEILMQREREIEVANAVSRLPADYQEVIMLRNLQRLPFDEVARRMARSRPAAQMLWMRALRKLQEVLAN